MSDEISNRYPEKERHYTLDEVMDLYGLDPWTIRMWGNWFGIPGYLSTADGGLLFTRQAVEQIEVIFRLMKKKMELEEVRKYLESGNR